MLTLPEHLMIFPVFVKFTLLVFYVCGVRVQSRLFVLVISIVSFCTISVLLYFWNYDVLDYSHCCWCLDCSYMIASLVFGTRCYVYCVPIVVGVSFVHS